MQAKSAKKFGARVYLHDDGVLEVSQTILRNGRYVIDAKSTERFVKPGDDRALGEAVRLACEGKL